MLIRFLQNCLILLTLFVNLFSLRSHIHLKPYCPLSFRAHVIKLTLTLSMVNLDVNCTNHLLFHRGKQWELGQVRLQFMCMSMTPHRSMCMWRAKEWVLPGLLRLKGFFIQKNTWCDLFLCLQLFFACKRTPFEDFWVRIPCDSCHPVQLLCMDRPDRCHWHAVALTLCFEGGDQSQQRKPSSYSQG